MTEPTQQTMLALWLHPAFAQPHEQGQRIITVSAPTFEDAANLLMSGQMIPCRDIQTHAPDPQNPAGLTAIGSRPMVIRAEAILRLARLDYQPLDQPAPPEPVADPKPPASNTMAAAKSRIRARSKPNRR